VDTEFLWERAGLFKKIRAFFDDRGYLAVDTPILSPHLIPESCLEVFETAYLPPGNRPPVPYWLAPSPEIWMKELLARHKTPLYQICRCFRNVESVGRLHNPEFTMLEYYTTDADYRDSLVITEEFFRALALDSPALAPPFTRISVEEAFSRWAGTDLYGAAARNALGGEARRLGLEAPPDADAADLYHLIFVHAVEPRLPKDRPVALMDYPAFVPCLAKSRGHTVERWELYVRGMELANCYSEADDPAAVREYLEREGRRKQGALVPHRIDPSYWEIFRDFPRCSGVAMGLDRLLMAITNRSLRPPAAGGT
jgi:lysyl-tRNA synthetase class 2